MGIVYLGLLDGAPVTSGSVIPMTTIIRRHNIDVSTNETLKGVSYFKVTVTANLESTAGGDATITLNKNNEAVHGAFATETIAANGATNLTFTAVVRNVCCNPISILSLTYTGPVLTANTVTMVIEHA